MFFFLFFSRIDLLKIFSTEQQDLFFFNVITRFQSIVRVPIRAFIHMFIYFYLFHFRIISSMIDFVFKKVFFLFVNFFVCLLIVFNTYVNCTYKNAYNNIQFFILILTEKAQAFSENYIGKIRNQKSGRMFWFGVFFFLV